MERRIGTLKRYILSVGEAFSGMFPGLSTMDQWGIYYTENKTNDSNIYRSPLIQTLKCRFFTCSMKAAGREDNKHLRLEFITEPTIFSMLALSNVIFIERTRIASEGINTHPRQQCLNKEDCVPRLLLLCVWFSEQNL